MLLASLLFLVFDLLTDLILIQHLSESILMRDDILDDEIFMVVCTSLSQSLE